MFTGVCLGLNELKKETVEILKKILDNLKEGTYMCEERKIWIDSVISKSADLHIKWRSGQWIIISIIPVNLILFYNGIN